MKSDRCDAVRPDASARERVARGLVGVTAMYLLAMAAACGLASSASADSRVPYLPFPGSTEMVASTANTLFDTRVFGYQLYESVGASGVPTGVFKAYEGDLRDVFGFTEHIGRVTQVIAGHAPPVGSEWDVFSGWGVENVYLDINGVITDTFYTPFGDFNIPASMAATLVPDLALLNTGSAGAEAVTLLTDQLALF